MSENSKSSTRGGRIRNALLASVLTVGVAGATGVMLSDGQIALAAPVEVPVAVQAAAPADFSAIVETVKPAVVGVQVKNNAEPVANRGTQGRMPEGFDDLPEDHPLNEFFRRFGMPRGDENGPLQPFRGDRGMSQGSGFFVSEDGYVVTNNHVVSDAREYKVITDDGRELDATLVGKDDRTDLAVLKVEGNGFPFVKLAQDEPKIGQWVIAVGNPFGLGGTVTAGIISAQGRDIGSGPYDNYLQIDAPVNRGNSGGPTFNTKGEVIGVNTAIFSPSGGNVGIAFAIPASTVSEVVTDLRADGEVTRGWLGVQIQPVTGDIAESLGIDGTEGAIVSDAQANSPAAAAGVLAGDVIRMVNGTPVKDPKDLSATISRIEPGQKIAVSVLRDGKEQIIDVTLGNLKDLDQSQQASAAEPAQPEEPAAQPASLDGLGLSVEEKDNGVVVSGIEDDSPASEQGIQSGDVIVSIGDTPVKTVADVEKGISSAKELGRGAVLFKVQREDNVRFVGVPLERG